MFTLYCFFFLASAILNVLAVPPAVCRAAFRWDDCGKPAKAVMYYWKEGSRCEIGFWKGCLPNPNMFADEYECINTCIFVDRPSTRVETEEPDVIDHNATDAGNGTANVTTEATANVTNATHEESTTGETTVEESSGTGETTVEESTAETTTGAAA